MAAKSEEERRNRQVAAYWSWVAKRGELGFWNVPGWQEHQNLLASGCPKINWLDVLSTKILEIPGYRPGTALSLGCGGGPEEARLLAKGLAKEAEGCDISPQLIEMAQREADKRSLPIRYFVCDLNRPKFESEKYSLIFAGGILHHIENLEALFPAVLRALRPGGVFLVYDYVGPTRFQWSQAQIEEGNRLLKEIPLSYRIKRGYPWYYLLGRAGFNALPFLKIPAVENLLQKALPPRAYAQFLRLKKARLVLDRISPPPVEQFEVTDPSEAVRSEEIIPLLKKHFCVKCSLPQGGTLVQPLFNRTAANYLNKRKGRGIAEKVFEKERELIQKGLISSDFQALLLTRE